MNGLWVPQRDRVKANLEDTHMKRGHLIAGALVMVCAAAPGKASMAFFRSMPDEGTWAEWRLESSIPFSKGVEPKVRLEAGKVTERDGRRLQVLEFSGTWEDDGKPVKFKGTYEVDLATLEKNGCPHGAVRRVQAYGESQGELKPLDAKDPRIAMYDCAMIELTSIAIEPDSVHLSEPARLKAFDLRLLKAKAKTPFFGEGDAPLSDFQAWVGAAVPFGVAKWTMTTTFAGDAPTVVKLTATLVDSGRACSAPTQPADKARP